MCKTNFIHILTSTVKLTKKKSPKRKYLVRRYRRVWDKMVYKKITRAFKTLTNGNESNELFAIKISFIQCQQSITSERIISSTLGEATKIAE